MMSIPDWAKFSRPSVGQKANTMAMLNKYYKQQEIEAIRQAEASGYFLEPNAQYVVQHMGPLSKTKKDMAKIFLVRLSGLHIRKLGDIPMCSSLQICVLPGNFLTRIDSLSSCQQLVKLDLHGNQLTSIPGPSFWSALRKLRAVHLHDNPLGKFETLQNLSAASSLQIVTLYDTPLYLKKNYRHHVVNSIWTLKALDSHVVSDEEIIEDAMFGSRFQALNPYLRLDLCPASPQNADYWQEAKLFQRLEAKINHILAKHSPVVIVQRYLRGYFTRKRLGLVKARKRIAGAATVMPVSGLGSQPTGDTMSVLSSVSGQAKGVGSENGVVPPSSPIPRSFGGVLLEGDTDLLGQRRNIFIDLDKLQAGTLQALDEAESLEPTHRTTTRSTPQPSTREKRHKSRDKKEPPKAPRIKSIKQFFGPVVGTQPDDAEGDDDDDEDQPVTHYRIHGKQPNFVLSDPTTDMILTRMTDGRHVREAEAERIQKVQAELPPKVMPHNFTNNNQRLFARVHGNMGLSCLMAVQRAYKDREMAERTTAKMEYIMAMREEKKRAKERIDMYHDDKRNQALRRRDQDRGRLLDQLEKKEMMRFNYLDKQQEMKGRVGEVNKTLHSDHTFVTEFNSQHTSVSKALMRHDRQARFEEKIISQKKKLAKLRMKRLKHLVKPKVTPPRMHIVDMLLELL